MDADFAINARPETVAQGFRRILRPWGYLIPPSGLTRNLRASLANLATANVPLIVDNGQFDDITRISTLFAPSIASIQAELVALEARLGRAPRWRDLEVVQRQTLKRLADELASSAASAEGMGLPEQLALSTAGVIGAEDITGALWLRAGLHSPAMPRTREKIRRRNTDVAKQAVVAISSLPRAARTDYLAVASALDYDTAFDAGRVFADAGLTGAAMGFGAFMADNSFADQFVIGARVHVLPRPLPMRYLRTALAARGFWDGWRHAGRRAPRRFHFLGLGAPIMMPIVAVAARGTPRLTFDATSPIRDAVEGTLYSSLGAYLKIRTRRIAERLASGQIRSWSCPCGFCRSFVRAHPFDYARGRLWGKQRPAGAGVSADDLRPSGVLFDAYPLMSEPPGGALRQAVSYARSGHNHWVVSQVLKDVRQHGQRGATLERHTERVVSQYQESTSSSYFAQAVALSLEIARGNFSG